jgi:hypothetical protein
VAVIVNRGQLQGRLDGKEVAVNEALLRNIDQAMPAAAGKYGGRLSAILQTSKMAFTGMLFRLLSMNSAPASTSFSYDTKNRSEQFDKDALSW